MDRNRNIRMACREYTSGPVTEEINGESIIVSGSDDVSGYGNVFPLSGRQGESEPLLSDNSEAYTEGSLRDTPIIDSVSRDRKYREMVMKLASVDVPVLLQGETGVGKDVTAHLIHNISGSSSRPFVKVNCGIIPEQLMESELFGYENGAFTGANRSGKKGIVEAADGGTLFLDEIGDMPYSLQVKLLDFIQDGVYTRVGGTARRKVNTRIITATNRNLKEMCRDGRFRRDLYYRINAISMNIPPLRDRHEDIDMLAVHFMDDLNEKYNRSKCLSCEARQRLHNYSWPGNIREMKHLVEHAYIFSGGDVITEEDVDDAMGNLDFETDSTTVILRDIMPLKEAKHEVERQLVTQAYARYGSTYKAAEALKCDQSTVVKIMSRYDLSLSG